MKVKDLFNFNPEAELKHLGKDHVARPLKIYGWGGAEGVTKEDCENVDLIQEDLDLGPEEKEA